MSTSPDLEKLRTSQDFGKGVFLGDNPGILNLSPEDRLKVSAWRHACPRPQEVAVEYGLEWTRQRYDECDLVFGSFIVEYSKIKPSLYRQLTSSVRRLPKEPMGHHEAGAVPESHKIEMSPLSTPWGYALPRVFIEQAGRGKDRSWERYNKAINLLNKAISLSETPIELLASLSNLVISADAKPEAVLGHIFARGILEEENCRTMYNQIAETIRKKCRRLWAHYSSMSSEQREKNGIIKNFPIPE